MVGIKNVMQPGPKHHNTFLTREAPWSAALRAALQF